MCHVILTHIEFAFLSLEMEEVLSCLVSYCHYSWRTLQTMNIHDLISYIIVSVDLHYQDPELKKTFAQLVKGNQDHKELLLNHQCCILLPSDFEYCWENQSKSFNLLWSIDNNWPAGKCESCLGHS